MAALRRCPACLLLITFLFVFAFASVNGCGNPAADGESTWRDEVNASLASLADAGPYRYDIHIENWVGVSGQSIYGDERGEGFCTGGDFSVLISRISPSGEEDLVYVSHNSEYYLQEKDIWRAIDEQDIPNPLYDTELFLELASQYSSISLEGEEELSGVPCRRYLLNLGGDKADKALPQRAWSYFSSLDFELNCRVWVPVEPSPPLSLRLEVIGFDPEERLQRYRVVATLDLYDFGSAEVQLVEPVM